MNTSCVIAERLDEIDTSSHSTRFHSNLKISKEIHNPSRYFAQNSHSKNPDLITTGLNAIKLKRTRPKNIKYFQNSPYPIMLRASKNSVKSNRSSSSGGAGLKFSFLRSSRTSVKSNRSSVSGRSFISRARQSFFRSKGDRGADVITLRGMTGSDFEGEARVTRGDIGMGLCFSCFFVDRGGEPVSIDPWT
jgi:hypothetical protein